MKYVSYKRIMISFDFGGWLRSSETVHFSEIMITMKQCLTGLIICVSFCDLVNNFVLGQDHEQDGFIQTILAQNINLITKCGRILPVLDCLIILLY